MQQQRNVCRVECTPKYRLLMWEMCVGLSSNEQGPQGLSGRAGPPGPDGVKGAKGSTGLRGAKGVQVRSMGYAVLLLRISCFTFQRLKYFFSLVFFFVLKRTGRKWQRRFTGPPWPAWAEGEENTNCSMVLHTLPAFNQCLCPFKAWTNFEWLCFCSGSPRHRRIKWLCWCPGKI